MVIYLCPADRKYACSWEGQAEDILHHFELEHDDLLHFSDTFTIDAKVPSENRLLLVDEEIYLAQLKCPGRSLEIRLRYLGPASLAKKITFSIFLRVHDDLAAADAIYADDGSFKVDLDKLVGDLACIRCTLNITKAAQIAEDEADYNLEDDPRFAARKFSLEELSTKDKDSSVKLRKKSSDIQLSRSKTINSVDMKRKLVSRCKSTLSLGAISETMPAMNCTNCGISLIPPISYCPCGQSFCDKCPTNTCYNCGNKVSEEQNNGLETRITRLLLPCKYQKYGCPVMILNNDSDHESHCVFCEYKCPIEECNIEGQFRSMVKHLKLIHGSTKLLECFFVAFQTYPEAFLAIEEKGIFYCRMLFREAHYFFEARYCGPKDRRFFCELQFKEGKLKQPMMLWRTENVYSMKISQQHLKKMKLKAKHAILTITA